MEHPGERTGAKRRALYATTGMVLLLLAGQGLAQPVYRVVGPDGRVTFSDRPPAADKARVPGVVGQATDDTGGTALLPFELRQVARKFPVTLYTASNCAPCNQGRALLGNRGIPYTERTINTAEDAAALQRLSGESALPLLTIGGQQLKGYADAEWTQFLNAAGYPAASMLPAGYRNPAATSLAAAVPQPVLNPKPEEIQSPRRPAEARPAAKDSDANPAGIRF